ncbi:MAG: M24 family metallopeptidase [Candidatus Hodarchaeota archaeon]
MNKFEKAQQILQDEDLDAWLIIGYERNDINSPFMLGVEAPSLHCIYISASGDHHIIAVEMEANMIKQTLDKKGVKAKVSSYASDEEFISLLKSTVTKPRIALNYGENLFTQESTKYADFLPTGQFFALKKFIPKTGFFSAAPIIYRLRSIKSKEEQKDLRTACKATIEILETIPDIVKLGMTENEIKAEIEYRYLKIGKPLFPTIVGTGAHSADPHHNTSNKKIEPGPLLIDSGLILDEIGSDITWTFWVGKNPSKEFIDAYEVLYESKEVANKYYTDGTLSILPAQKCREYLAEKGFDHKKLFIHGLGHALGFVPHDVGPRINMSASVDSILKENMIYTNEPGFYWTGKWGIRLEDDIIIGKEKCEQVTYNPKDPIVI